MPRFLTAARSRADLLASYVFGAPDNVGQGQFLPGHEPQGTLIIACSACTADNDTDARFCSRCGAAFANGTPPEPEPDAPPVADPSDETGDIDNGVICQNPDCGHLASAHANTDTGANTGVCSTDGCDCEAMTVDADVNPAGGEDGGGDVEADTIGTQALAAEDTPPAVAPAEPDDGVELNAPPETQGGDSMGPAFTIPVAIIEGQPTCDGRQIAVGALTWRVPPLPLMGLATETHDPNGIDMNDPAVICGRIDTLERLPGEADTAIILARGYYLPNQDGMYFAELNEAMGRLGISADVAVQSSEVTIEDIDSDGWPTDISETLTDGTIMGLTVCPYPAFEGAYIVLGDGTDMPAAQTIPQTTEGAPVVADQPPAVVAAGGQLVHLIAYEDCVPCQTGIQIVASAAPTRPPAAWFSDPNFTPDDGRLVEILDQRGDRSLGGKYACPITVTDDGRVYGHIAPWGVCHTGNSNQCIVAPHSSVDYAHFKRGQHIITAEGDHIRVGVLTADTGHAPTRGISATQAMAHYDNTALAAADVNIGEDEYGIWVAGAMRPDATDEQVRKLRAGSISGDWRQLGGQLELVAALAVNQPGFPLAVVAGGQLESLVATGASVMHALKRDHNMDPTFAALGPLAKKYAQDRRLPLAKHSARERLAAL